MARFTEVVQLSLHTFKVSSSMDLFRIVLSLPKLRELQLVRGRVAFETYSASALSSVLATGRPAPRLDKLHLSALHPSLLSPLADWLVSSGVCQNLTFLRLGQLEDIENESHAKAIIQTLHSSITSIFCTPLSSLGRNARSVHPKEVHNVTAFVGHEPDSESRAPASLKLKIRNISSPMPDVAHHGQITYMKAGDALPDISSEPGRQSRCYHLTRHDPLGVRFSRRVMEDVTVDEDLLKAIARFNYYLYLFHISTDIAGEPSFRAKFYRLVASTDRELAEDLHQVLVPADDEDDFFAYLHPQFIRTDSMQTSANSIPVRELVIRGSMLNSYYGLSLSNESRHALFFYAVCLDPGDYSIQVGLDASSTSCDLIPVLKWLHRSGFLAGTTKTWLPYLREVSWTLVMAQVGCQLRSYSQSLVMPPRGATPDF